MADREKTSDHADAQRSAGLESAPEGQVMPGGDMRGACSLEPIPMTDRHHVPQ
jgi:hypothetical protein